MNRKHICSITFFLLCASLLYAGQSASKVAKMGDKAATKGIIHKRQAARRKSRLTRRLADVEAA